MTLPANFHVDQGELLEAAIRVGYLAHIEEVYCDPVTGAPELSERTVRIEADGNRYTLSAGGPSFVEFYGWDGIEITHLYDNPECVGCGRSTDVAFVTRCRHCRAVAHAESGWDRVAARRGGGREVRYDRDSGRYLEVK